MKRNITVFGGGTATNSLVFCFNAISNNLTYVLPISDNGGSTSEILRIIGGPAIGDIKSRVIKLIQDPHLINVFSYRLPEDPIIAKTEWGQIVEGVHNIWKNVPSPLKEIIRPFIVHIQSELLKKNKNNSPFNFSNASIGNLFLTGSRLFLGSLEASIELVLRIGLCDPKIAVLPCINSNHTYHISALLKNNEIITGQSQISHPSSKNTPDVEQHLKPVLLQSDISSAITKICLNQNFNMNGEDDEEEEEYANPICIHPDLKNSQLYFEKICNEKPLPSPISKIFYINPYGEEICPIGNVRVISKLKECEMIVYSIGSLMTSLLPLLILGNISETIFETDMKKVLLINNSYDRETFGMSGLHYVQMIIESMTQAVIKHKQKKDKLNQVIFSWNRFITDVLYLEKGDIVLDTKPLLKNGIRCHPINSKDYENDKLIEILQNL